MRLPSTQGALPLALSSHPIGTIVDERYEIVSSLGAGGMGEVYLTREIELDRLVALKILHALIEKSDDSRLRFEREARSLAALNHKNIVSFLHFGVWKQHPYMVMEYLQGVTLKQIIERERLPWRRALSIGSQLCDALSHVHAHGIVHRDLKPSNILRISSETQDVVKVMDFGLAGCLPDTVLPAQKLTRTGDLVGTIHYVSPEQACGTKPDHRSDIYSLGCVLHELISGSPPLDAENLEGLAYLHVHQLAKPLSEVLGQTLPPDLDRLLLTAMAKDPGERYQSMDEFKSDIELVLSDGTAGDRSRPRAGQKPHKQQAPRNSARRAGLIVLALVCVVVVASYSAPVAIDLALTNLPRDAWVDTGLAWTRKLNQLRLHGVATGVLNRLEELSRQRHDLLALSRAESVHSQMAFASGHTEESQRYAAQAVETLSQYCTSKHAWDPPREVQAATDVLQAVRSNTRSLPANMIDGLNVLGAYYRTTADTSYGFARASADIAQRVYSTLDGRTAKQMCLLAASLAGLGRQSEAEKCLKTVERALPYMHRPDSTWLMIDVVAVWQSLGNSTRVRELLPLILASDLVADKVNLLLPSLADNDSLTAQVFDQSDGYGRYPHFILWYAMHLAGCNRDAQAYPYCRKLLTCSTVSRVIKFRAAMVAASYRLELGQIAETLKLADTALSLSGDDVDLAEALTMRGAAYAKAGKIKDSESNFERALKLAQCGTSVSDIRILHVQEFVFVRTSHWEQAARVAQLLLDRATKEHCDATGMAIRYMNLAKYQLLSGNRAAGLKTRQSALPYVTQCPTGDIKKHLLQMCDWYVTLSELEQATKMAKSIASLRDLAQSEPESCTNALRILEIEMLKPNFHQPGALASSLWQSHHDCLVHDPMLATKALLTIRQALAAARERNPDVWRQQAARVKEVLSIARNSQSGERVINCLILEEWFCQEQLGQRANPELEFDNFWASPKSHPAQRVLYQVQLDRRALNGDIAGASRIARECIALDERNALDIRDIVTDTVALARVLAKSGRTAEAKALVSDTLARNKKELDKDGLLKLLLLNCVQPH